MIRSFIHVKYIQLETLQTYKSYGTYYDEEF